MSDSANTPQVPHELTDEELNSISGGTWSYKIEQHWMAKYQMLKNAGQVTLPFEPWINHVLGTSSPLDLQDRELWVLAGRPKEGEIKNPDRNVFGV